MLVANRSHDDYTGNLAIGRIFRGSVAPGDALSVLGASDETRPARVGQVLLQEPGGQLPAQGGGALLALAKGDQLPLFAGIKEQVKGSLSLLEPLSAQSPAGSIVAGGRLVHGVRWG